MRDWITGSYYVVQEMLVKITLQQSIGEIKYVQSMTNGYVGLDRLEFSDRFVAHGMLWMLTICTILVLIVVAAGIL